MQKPCDHCRNPVIVAKAPFSRKSLYPFIFIRWMKFHSCSTLINSLVVAMENDKWKKTTNKGGEIIRFEPQGLQLIDSNPVIKECFEKDGRIVFCENM